MTTRQAQRDRRECWKAHEPRDAGLLLELLPQRYNVRVVVLVRAAPAELAEGRERSG